MRCRLIALPSPETQTFHATQVARTVGEIPEPGQVEGYERGHSLARLVRELSDLIFHMWLRHGGSAELGEEVRSLPNWDARMP